MTEEAQSRQQRRRRIKTILAALTALLLIVFVPPWISVGRYKGRITQLMEASLGRPVRLSSVNVRLLPRPGFVLYDLSVAEDTAYGSEPVLHANTVTASLRFFPLWRGRLEIGKIDVDEASLNLVRTGPGLWNLNTLFRTAAAKAGVETGGVQLRAMRLPSLEATNSRINFKNGVEKLPYSLLNTDLSFQQESSGEWKIQLRGQPARTDVSMDLADTGIVQMEGAIRPAAGLREMPVQMDLEWREAQLGQLARLVTGSDPGWRGDLTGQIHMEGTADAARITTRLRATGIHRAEFAPQTLLDFDSNCNLVYHFTERTFENLACDSPLGNGRIRLTGSIAELGPQTRLQADLNSVPVAAVLDVMRILRSNIDAGLAAAGTVSGSIVYDANAAKAAVQGKAARGHAARTAAQGPLTGSLTVDGLELSGGGLSQPIRVPKFTLQAAADLPGQPRALAGSAGISAGGATPIQIGLRFSISGYQINMRGPAALTRVRDLAHAAGLAQATMMESLAGDPAALELSAKGGWLPAAETLGKDAQGGTGAPEPVTLSGTITLHNANWHADYMANHIVLSQATLHLDSNGAHWEPVNFTFGPVKGTASLSQPASCGGEANCAPALELQFGALDAAILQEALLGARQPGTLLSTLISRFHSTSSPEWLRLDTRLKADSLRLGPVTLEKPVAVIRILPTAAEIDSLDAVLFGGPIHLSGSIEKAATSTDKPKYTLEGSFEKLSASSAGALLGLRWAGGPLSGDGKIELSGFTGEDLAASARGSLHFECRSGAIGNQPTASSKAGPVPAALGRFDHWSGDGEIDGGRIAFKASEVESGSQTQTVDATAVFGTPAKMSFTTAEKAPAGKK